MINCDTPVETRCVLHLTRGYLVLEWQILFGILKLFGLSIKFVWNIRLSMAYFYLSLNNFLSISRISSLLRDRELTICT